MEMEWIVEAGIAMAVVGFFVAAWFRHSRSMRLVNSRTRQEPELSATASADTSRREDGARRAPTV